MVPSLAGQAAQLWWRAHQTSESRSVMVLAIPKVGTGRELVLLHRGRVLASGATAAMLNPALIGKLYGVEVDITANARTGQLTVIPVARAAESPQP